MPLSHTRQPAHSRAEQQALLKARSSPQGGELILLHQPSSASPPGQKIWRAAEMCSELPWGGCAFPAANYTSPEQQGSSSEHCGGSQQQKPSQGACSAQGAQMHRLGTRSSPRAPPSCPEHEAEQAVEHRALVLPALNRLQHSACRAELVRRDVFVLGKQLFLLSFCS